MTVRMFKIALAGFVTIGAWACEPPADVVSTSPSASSGEPENGEQSPNARILPEPLEEGGPTRDTEEPDASAESIEKLVRPRAKPRPFPLGGPLGDDTLKRGLGAGFEMQLQIDWAESRKNAKWGDQQLELWPNIRVQLLREGPGRPARMRWIMESQAFPLPPATELRARADRIGHVVIWPNQRSYRVAPPGSLHSLFADRRVDRVPFVEAEMHPAPGGDRLGKETTKLGLSTPIGNVELEFVEVKELPYASQLLCGALVEIVRVRATPEICPMHFLPVHFQFVWANEEKLDISVLSWGAVANLNLDEFRLPPDLPIFKPGELPPFDDYFVSEKARFELLPLTKEKGKPVLVAPPEPAPPGPDGKPAPVPPPAVGPPENEIVLKNELNRPLVVLVNQIPFVWLAPGDRLPVYLTSDDIRVSARDFLGETIFTERTLTAPAQLHFGGAEEATAATPAKDQ